METLRIPSFLMTWYPVKIINLKYREFFGKVFSEMSYLVRGFMTSRPNDQCFCQNRGIVCYNVSILCTHVYLGMTNNVYIGSFPFRSTKEPFSIFRVPKTGCFVKQPPRVGFKMVPAHFSKILDHITWKKSQMGYLKHFGPPLVKKINVCRIRWKWVGFELQLHNLLLMIF